MCILEGKICTRCFLYKEGLGSDVRSADLDRRICALHQNTIHKVYLIPEAVAAWLSKPLSYEQARHDIEFVELAF